MSTAFAPTEYETDLGTFDVVYRGPGLVGLRKIGNWDAVLPARLGDNGIPVPEDMRAILHLANLIFNAVGPAGQWPPAPFEEPDPTHPDAVIVNGKFIGYRAH